MVFTFGDGCTKINLSHATVRDTCSSKGQLERAKLESLKLESFAEVGKSQAKLERTGRSWKEPSEVRKFLLKLESFAVVGKFRCSWKV